MTHFKVKDTNFITTPNNWTLCLKFRTYIGDPNLFTQRFRDRCFRGHIMLLKVMLFVKFYQKAVGLKVPQTKDTE